MDIDEDGLSRRTPSCESAHEANVQASGRMPYYVEQLTGIDPSMFCAEPTDVDAHASCPPHVSMVGRTKHFFAFDASSPSHRVLDSVSASLLNEVRSPV